MTKLPSVKQSRCIGTGKWLQLNELNYTDKHETTRTWESVSRHQCAGAVAIIATLKPSNQIILIRQYRPPADAYVIEFPAGLIDIGETPESTAARELYEETGYTGEIIKMTNPVYNSPGLTSETVHIALMNIDETKPENQNVTPAPEEGEDIEPLLVEKSEIETFLEKCGQRGDTIDAKVMAFTLNQQ